jgi:hypothetical protein
MHSCDSKPGGYMKSEEKVKVKDIRRQGQRMIPPSVIDLS